LRAGVETRPSSGNEHHTQLAIWHRLPKAHLEEGHKFSFLVVGDTPGWRKKELDELTGFGTNVQIYKRGKETGSIFSFLFIMFTHTFLAFPSATASGQGTYTLSILSFFFLWGIVHNCAFFNLLLLFLFFFSLYITFVATEKRPVTDATFPTFLSTTFAWRMCEYKQASKRCEEATALDMSMDREMFAYFDYYYYRSRRAIVGMVGCELSGMFDRRLA
jgi:hypothetical protein